MHKAKGIQKREGDIKRCSVDMAQQGGVRSQEETGGPTPGPDTINEHLWSTDHTPRTVGKS